MLFFSLLANVMVLLLPSIKYILNDNRSFDEDVLNEKEKKK